jgi:hypothetical protein
MIEIGERTKFLMTHDNNNFLTNNIMELRMIEQFSHIGTDHICNVCSCEFSDDEGGIQGYFGILPVAFCPTCYSSMYDMVQQDMEYMDDLDE